jgi:hypothetical protein
MAAKFIPIGECAHDAERQTIRFLVDSLPATYTVYGNRGGGYYLSLEPRREQILWMPQ